MPDPKDNAKMTGDTHLPDVEADDLAFQEGMTDSIGADGTPRGRAKAADESRPGRGIRKAGLLKDSDDSSAAGDEQRDADQRSGPT